MRSHLITPLMLLAALGTATSARAASTVTLAPATGHPNIPVTMSGASFGDSEAVDIYLDTVDTQLLVSSATGAFSASVTIPASTPPGKHYLTAIGRRSGDAAQATFLVTTNWAEQGFGAAHLGWNPYENTLNSSNIESLGTLWQIPSNALGGAPAVALSRVFVGGSTGFEAVAATTGAVLWKVLPNSSFYASPAVSGATLFVGDYNNSTMYSLNVSTGALLWSQATIGGFYSSAVVASGLVYAGCLDGRLYAFNASTGKVLWSFSTGSGIDGSPAVVGGVVYIGSEDDKVYALNATTGALIWSYQTGSSVESPVSVYNGAVYVGSDDDKFYALSATSGTLLWSNATGGAIYSPAAVASGKVYYGSSDGNLYAANAHSGAIIWQTALGDAVGGASVANGVVYVSTRNNSIFALDANTGVILASGAAGSSLFGNPAISDGVVYFNSTGSTYAFALLAGTDVTAQAVAQAPKATTLRPDMSLVAKR